MEDPSPWPISTVNLNRRGIFAVRDWPPGCGPGSQLTEETSGCKIENVEGQDEYVGDNWGLSSKRYMKSKFCLYPPPKRRGVFAIRDFPPSCGPNFSSNLDLTENKIEIDTNCQEIDQEEKGKVVYNEYGLWENKSENKPAISTQLVPFEANKEDEFEVYDYAIRTITNNKMCIRKTARKSVRGPPNSKLVLSERKPNKQVEKRAMKESSTSLTIYKDKILNTIRQPLNERTKVKQALRYFHTVYRTKMQNEKSGSHTKEKRIDLKSGKTVKKSPLYKDLKLNKAILGTVPGVQVGDEFRYRMELHLIGLHRPLQSGIDYTDFNGVRVATSIVSSGGYSDELRSSDVLIYSGAGGKPNLKKGRESKPEDQKLEKGNLALKNSMDLKTPVRVIHGLNTSDTSRVVMTFTYDGIYIVEGYKYEDEIYTVSGRKYIVKVFKFILRRIAGQPETGLHMAARIKSCRVREGLCIEDISKGKEKIPICVINTIDNEKPPKFNYIINCIYPSWYQKSLSMGCRCKGECSNAKCSCAVKNGGNIPFTVNGLIVEEKRVIYECGPSCNCVSSCPNRVTQKRIVYPLEIFRKEDGEWGVRSLGSISCGSFVCEFVGEVIVLEGENGVKIEGGVSGNVGRFVKRSASPNLMVQRVLFGHGDDESLAHVMFFAADNIPPLQELTY